MSRYMGGTVKKNVMAVLVAAAAGLFGNETPGRALQDPAGQQVVLVGVVGQRA